MTVNVKFQRRFPNGMIFVEFLLPKRRNDGCILETGLFVRTVMLLNGSEEVVHRQLPETLLTEQELVGLSAAILASDSCKDFDARLHLAIPNPQNSTTWEFLQEQAKQVEGASSNAPSHRERIAFAAGDVQVVATDGPMYFIGARLNYGKPLGEEVFKAWCCLAALVMSSQAAYKQLGVYFPKLREFALEYLDKLQRPVSELEAFEERERDHLRERRQSEEALRQREKSLSNREKALERREASHRALVSRPIEELLAQLGRLEPSKVQDHIEALALKIVQMRKELDKLKELRNAFSEQLAAAKRQRSKEEEAHKAALCVQKERATRELSELTERQKQEFADYLADLETREQTLINGEKALQTSELVTRQQLQIEHLEKRNAELAGRLHSMTQQVKAKKK